MILAYLLLFTGLTISSVAIYYSVVGLTAIFSAAAVPIMIMGVSLEVAKLVCATWIKQYWTRVPLLMKTYMVTAVVLLMLITSMGIFGFLSKAHNDQNLVSGDVGAKLAIYDEKIRTARDNIDAGRKQLQQMDAAVDQVMGRSTDEKGADKAVAIRNSQKRDRAAIAKDIEANQRIISQINDEAAPIRAENRKVEAEVGPIKYLAAFIYGVAPDATMLEKAVTWIIIMIVVVFDPLAVIMLLASQMTFGWTRQDRMSKKEAELVGVVDSDPTIDPPKKMFAGIADKIEQQINNLHAFRDRFKRRTDSVAETAEPVLEPVPEHLLTNIPKGSELAVADSPSMEPVLEKPEVPWVETRGLDEDSEVVETSAWTDEDYDRLVQEILENREASIPVDEEPIKKDTLPKFSGFGIPLTAPYMQTKVAEKTSVEKTPEVVVKEPDVIPAPNPEAAPGRNRGVMTSQIPIEADNAPKLGKATHSDFGNQFPESPERGDVYLRTDYLPNRLFKFNGNKWIQVDKESTDVYAYEEAYIKHLIDEIEAGRYDVESLTEIEKQQIQEYLNKN